MKAGVFKWGILLEKNEKWHPQELVLVLEAQEREDALTSAPVAWLWNHKPMLHQHKPLNLAYLFKELPCVTWACKYLVGFSAIPGFAQLLEPLRP